MADRLPWLPPILLGPDPWEDAEETVQVDLDQIDIQGRQGKTVPAVQPYLPLSLVACLKAKISRVGK